MSQNSFKEMHTLRNSVKRSRSGDVPSLRERRSASSFFSPETWLQSNWMPVMEFHTEKLLTNKLTGALEV